jgi:hypothetical protein
VQKTLISKAFCNRAGFPAAAANAGLIAQLGSYLDTTPLKGIVQRW